MANKGKRGLFLWGTIGGGLLILFLIVNILATSVFSDLISLVMPGSIRPIFKEGVESYYLSDYNYTTKSGVYQAAKDFNVQLGEEGFTLLKNKNEALPLYTKESNTNKPSAAPKISVFGKNSVNLAYGGSGSSGVASSSRIDLYEALEKAGYEYNPTLRSFYEDPKASGAVRETSGTNLDDGKTVVLSTAETPYENYTQAVKNSYAEYSDAALVVLTRVGGEGMDLPRTMRGATGGRSDDDHFLQLDKNEANLISQVCKAGFKKVIIVINACSAMELGFLEEDSSYVQDKEYDIDPSKIDAAIWMGYPGDTATLALGEILNGNVNPSGHTVDTYVTDLKKDPTWNNFGDNLTAGGDQYSLNGTKKLYYFVDYEESVYVGYRYYETRGAQEGEDWYNGSVVYPFGYGLSYTSFEWELEDASSINNVTIDKDGTYTVRIKVTNTGSVAGKDVVQLYGHAPYTEGGIEKPEEILLDFAKTELIQPGKSTTVELTFDPYYLASYDYSEIKVPGGGYILEEGTGYSEEGTGYSLYISHNSHDKEFKIPFKVNTDILYSQSTVNEKVTVSNLYTNQSNAAFNSDTQLSTLLSRSDWEGTWPTTPNTSDWEQNATFFAQLDDTSPNSPDYSDVEMPYFEEDNGMVLRDMLFDENGDILDEDGDGIPFVSYDDERWDALLDQAKISEMIHTFDYAAYTISKIESIGMPTLNCGDGPVGWTCFMNADIFYDNCNYTAEMVVASTWSKELVEEFGKMIGEEGLIGNEKVGLPYSGIYAPGANIHRSAFGGRNAEYFSEDPVLTGKLAAAEIKGMQSKGTIPFIKHFALNEQETHRSISGDCSWVTEQAMREIYLRGFEIAVKEGQARGVMTSFNRIGTRWTGGDYRLLTTILRDEWGFNGAVICDFNTIPKYMNSKQMAYAGGDLNLATQPVSWCDESSAADVYVLRKCIKNIAYAVVNSNAMNGEIIGYKMAMWKIGLIIADMVVGIAIIVWGSFAVIGYVKGRKKED